MSTAPVEPDPPTRGADFVHSLERGQAVEELGAIALFHTGQTGIGTGLPGGRGIRLRCSDPLLEEAKPLILKENALGLGGAA